MTKASVPYDAIKQAVVRVFSVLLLLASVWFWLDGSLPLAYGLIWLMSSFMVFNDLENAGNMASLLQMLAASMDTANSIDDTPVMDEKGADITPKSSEIVFNKVDFSYADRKILDQVSFTIPEKNDYGHCRPFRGRKDNDVQPDCSFLGCECREDYHRRYGCTGF